MTIGDDEAGRRREREIDSVVYSLLAGDEFADRVKDAVTGVERQVRPYLNLRGTKRRGSKR